MKLLLVLVSVFVLQAAVAAADDYVDGTTVYRWSGVATEFPTPEAACKAGVAELAKNGNKQEFLSVKAGTDDKSMSCVLRDLLAKPPSVWTQQNLVAKLVKCPPTTSVRSVDNSGTFASQRCHCDDAVHGCPGAAPPPQAPAGRPVKPEDLCKQTPADAQARAPVSPADATAWSGELAALRGSNRHGRAMQQRYAAAAKIVDANHAGFEEFAPKDFYPGRPSDINIGQLCGSYLEDFRAANAIAGLKCTPIGYTWHHHEDLGRMQLVKTSKHRRSHGGGVAIWKEAFCNKGVRSDMCRYRDGGSDPKCANP
jgi:hypothetical protein